MALQFLIPAAIQGASSLAGHFRRKKTPKFEETAEGRRLMGVSREGEFNPLVRRSLLSGVSRRGAETAEIEKNRIQGNLIARGMGDSIAGQSLLAQPGLNRIRTVGEAAEDIERRNELSKERARDEFARGVTQAKEQRRQETNQARMGLISGLTSAAGQAYQGVMQGRQEGFLKQLPPEKYGDLVNATLGGVKIPPTGMKYFINTPDSGFTDEELEFLRNHPELFN